MFLVHHRWIAAHIVQLFPSGMLTQVNTLRLRCSGIIVSGAVLALTTLFLWDVIVVPPPLPSELHVVTRYNMSVHVMTDDAEYWHLHLQAFTHHLKTKKKREHKQLQLTCKKIRVITCIYLVHWHVIFSLTCVFTRKKKKSHVYK